MWNVVSLHGKSLKLWKFVAMGKVAYWKELADYDLETAEVMYNGGRWLYVGFMCHLVIEKKH